MMLLMMTIVVIVGLIIDMAMHDNNNTIIITMMIVGAGISISPPGFPSPGLQSRLPLDVRASLRAARSFGRQTRTRGVGRVGGRNRDVGGRRVVRNQACFRTCGAAESGFDATKGTRSLTDGYIYLI